MNHEKFVASREPVQREAGVPVAATRRWSDLPPLGFLGAIVASDYKFRTRDPAQALATSIDGAIVIELGIYALVAVALLRADTPRIRAGSLRAHEYFACLYVGLLVLSLTYTPYLQYGLVRVAQMSLLLWLVMYCANFSDIGVFHRLSHGFIVLVAISVVYGTLVPSPPISSLQAGRFTWLAIHPVVSAVLTGIASLLCLGYVLHGDRPRFGPRWSPSAYACLLAVASAALVASRTRGAVLGVACGAGALLLSSGPRHKRATTLGLITLITVIAWMTFGDEVVAYFVRDSSAEELTSLNSRTDLWAVALAAAGERPLFGYGVTAARGIFYAELGLGGGHNAIVNVLVEVGVAGLSVWLLLVATLGWGIWRLNALEDTRLQFDRSVMLAVLAFLMANGMFYEGAGATSNVAATWLLVLVAWLSVVQRVSSRPSGPARRRNARAEGQPGDAVRATSSGLLGP